jgi:hypothetical protein
VTVRTDGFAIQWIDQGAQTNAHRSFFSSVEASNASGAPGMVTLNPISDALRSLR